MTTKKPLECFSFECPRCRFNGYLLVKIQGEVLEERFTDPADLERFRKEG